MPFFRPYPERLTCSAPLAVSRRASAGRAVVLVAALVSGSAGSALADVDIRWQNGAENTDTLLADYLAESNILSDFVTLVDENFALEPPLVLSIGGGEGPAYEVDNRTLSMPYEYLADAVRAQENLVETREEALARGLDMIEYTLYLLLGQALLSDTSIEADPQAESLASWVMISHWPNGGEQWYAAVTAFAQASQKLDGPLSDFWHAHALYRLREEHLKCLILGSAPMRYESLMPATLEPAVRRGECEQRWTELQSDALVRLDDLLLVDAPLRGD